MGGRGQKRDKWLDRREKLETKRTIRGEDIIKAAVCLICFETSSTKTSI